jgi:tripartite-type tricarboxylate transporter receptor subunit TctC
MFNLRQIGGIFATCAIAMSIPGHAGAQEPPPVVKIMVGSAAGGVLDPYARIVGEHMSKTLGRTIIVENKPGANGNIAAQFIVDQPADGSWLWIGTQAMTEINPIAYKNLRWGIDDFIPIVKGVEAPLVFAVHPSVPARNLNEWIAWVKANPGKLGYASFSPGTPSAFLGHQLNKRFGLDLTHIVYKGSGPQTQDMVAGHALMGFMQLGNAIPHIKAGKITPIAVTSAKRTRFLPDVPTFAELGHDDFTAMVWFGLLTKKGTPEPIVRAYIAAAEKAHADPGVQQKFEGQGMETTGVTGPAKLTADIKVQIERWRKIVDETGFKAD